MKSKHTQQSSPVENRPGAVAPTAFTLVELLVVICVVSLLTATLVPTLAGSRIGSESFRCLNNNRQLCSACTLDRDDHTDRTLFSSSQTSTAPSSRTSALID